MERRKERLCRLAIRGNGVRKEKVEGKKNVTDSTMAECDGMRERRGDCTENSLVVRSKSCVWCS